MCFGVIILAGPETSHGRDPLWKGWGGVRIMTYDLFGGQRATGGEGVAGCRFAALLRPHHLSHARWAFFAAQREGQGGGEEAIN